MMGGDYITLGEAIRCWVGSWKRAPSDNPMGDTGDTNNDLDWFRRRAIDNPGIAFFILMAVIENGKGDIEPIKFDVGLKKRGGRWSVDRRLFLSALRTKNKVYRETDSLSIIADAFEQIGVSRDLDVERLGYPSPDDQ